MTNRRKFIAAVGALGVGTLAGCAGDDKATEAPTEADTPADTEAPTEADTPADTETSTETDILPTNQTAKLSASDADSDDPFGDQFGRSAVSGDGSTALVGAYRDKDPNGNLAGSTYVFSRADDTWSEEAKLSASDGDSRDEFGSSVAVSGDGSTALVGAEYDEDPNGTDAGSAYVFSRADDTWSEEAKLSASDGDSGERFGGSVAMSEDGSTALVGAWADRDPNGNSAGSAYVFSRAEGAWSEEAKLSASDGDSEDQFGCSVAVSGDGSTAVVGAFRDEDPNGTDAGSAYVFG